MTIVKIGLSHRTAQAEVLEQLVIPAARLDEMLPRLHELPALDEVVVLSTCNRIEVYASTRGPADWVATAVAEVVARGRVAVHELLRWARVRVGAAAVEHLFSVACGLDSMAVGEDQIVAQIKAAVRAATEAGTIGPVLISLMDAALRVSKRSRTETTISTAGISLARAGIDLAETHLGGLAATHAVVVGSGAVGGLAAQLLREGGVGRLSVASRSEASAITLATKMQARPLRAVDVPETLADANLVVAATGCVAPVVLAEQVRTAREQVGDRPLFVLDLGMPPDVEPAVGRLPGVTLVDIAALGRHLTDREVPDEVPRVRAIVAAEVATYHNRMNEAAAAPFVAAMHTHVRNLAEVELLRLHNRLPCLTERQRAETTVAVHRIIRKFLHRPTLRAKELATDPDGAIFLEALRELFDLGTSHPAE